MLYKCYLMQVRHQKIRYDDLQSAYKALEKKSDAPVVSDDTKYSQRSFEYNIEGGLATATPRSFNKGRKSSNDKSIQLELYQEQAQLAANDIEDLQTQLKDALLHVEERDRENRDLRIKLDSFDGEMSQLNEDNARLNLKNQNLQSILDEQHQRLDSAMSKLNSTSALSAHQDAHSWWQYVWHEMKKYDNGGDIEWSHRPHKSLSINGSESSFHDDNTEMTIQNSRLKDVIRRQAVEIANVRQVCENTYIL